MKLKFQLAKHCSRCEDSAVRLCTFRGPNSDAHDLYLVRLKILKAQSEHRSRLNSVNLSVTDGKDIHWLERVYIWKKRRALLWWERNLCGGILRDHHCRHGAVTSALDTKQQVSNNRYFQLR